jgi:hypothetical protein
LVKPAQNGLSRFKGLKTALNNFLKKNKKNK